jgi:alkylhydroperoxidase family enzyme
VAFDEGRYYNLKAPPRKVARHRLRDKAILQITLIAAWFDCINRVADALSVGRDQVAAGES